MDIAPDNSIFIVLSKGLMSVLWLGGLGLI